MVEAGVQAGYPRTDDLNGYQQEGFGQWTVRLRLKAAVQVPHVVIWIWQRSSKPHYFNSRDDQQNLV